MSEFVYLAALIVILLAVISFSKIMFIIILKKLKTVQLKVDFTSKNKL